MKKPALKFALLIALPALLIIASYRNAIAASTNSYKQTSGIIQGSDMEARLQAIEKRIYSLKQAIANKPELKQHRGALSSLENKKNALKAKLKSSDDKAKGQIEQDMKDLEAKVSSLESSIK